MKTFLLMCGIVLLTTACSNNKVDKDTSSDSSKFTAATMVRDDTQQLTTVDAVSADELKDDSVFADGSIPTSWENAGIKDVQGLKLFLKQLQQLVMLNDKTRLADHVQYPLKDVTGKEELIRRYDELFTKEVKLSLATINFNQLFRNQAG